MNIDRVVMLFAGTVILAGTAAAYFWQEPLWLIVPAFVGANLFQASLTGFCPLALILKAMGLESGCAFK
jgi:hypothetical protein